MNVPDGMRGGIHELEVSFPMPNGLPGTFFHKSTITAYLSYNIYIELRQDSDCIGSAWAPIIVMQSGRMPPAFGINGRKTAEVKKCYCCLFICSKGQMELNANVDKN